MLLQIIIGAAATAIVLDHDRGATRTCVRAGQQLPCMAGLVSVEGPALQRAYEGATEGAGAIYKWAGSGEGRMTIEQSDRPSRIAIKLEYFKPYQATNSATFTFVPDPRGTTVTRAMDGRNNFAARAFFLFKDLDKTVGVAFERGLAAMKTAAERALPREGRA